MSSANLNNAPPSIEAEEEAEAARSVFETVPLSNGEESPSGSDDNEDEVEFLSPAVVPAAKVEPSIIKTRSQARALPSATSSTRGSKGKAPASKSAVSKPPKRGTKGAQRPRLYVDLPPRVRLGDPATPEAMPPVEDPSPVKSTRGPAGASSSKSKGKGKASPVKAEAPSSVSTSLASLQSSIPALNASDILQLEGQLSSLPSVGLYFFLLFSITY